MLKAFKIAAIFLLLSEFLYCDFNFNDYMNFSTNYSNQDIQDNNLTMRFDNRFVAEYNKDIFKFEFHLLSSVSNLKNNGFQIPIDLVIEDDKYSLLNLISVKYNEDNSIINKIDRLNISLENEKSSLLLGRSTITWSRGRTFHVLDFFNPQNPAFYDGDYKLGTDIVAFNYSFNQKNSISLVANPKRNHNSLDITLEDSSFGFRYLFNNDIIDASLIMGQYLRDYALGGGVSTDFLFSSVLRSDIAFYKPEYNREENKMMLMVGLEKSLDIFGSFTSIYLEYYHNDFGISSIHTSNIRDNISSTMIRRLEEQDTYLLSKDYLSLGANIELTTYIYFNYSNTISLKDGSIFNFLGASYNYSDRLDLTFSLGIPYGKKGDEFGEICDANNEQCTKVATIVLFGFSYAI